MIAIAAVAALLFAMLDWSWLAWPDVLVDYGRELYVPWRLLEGDVLYRDIAYFNGPLSPYLNALWFRLFGVGIQTLSFANLALLVLLLIFLYAIILDVAGELAAAIGCAAVVLLFAFGQIGSGGSYSFISPYSHESTHGLLLGVATLYSVRSYARRPGVGRAAAIGFLAGFAFLTKAEIFLPTAAAVGAGIAASLWSERAAPGVVAAHCAALALASGVPVAGAFGLLALAMSAPQALRGLLGAWPLLKDSGITSMEFYRNMAGIDDVTGNLAAMGSAVIVYATCFAPVLATALLWKPERARLAVSFLFFSLGLFLATQVASDFWLHAARPLPLFMILLIAQSTFALLRRRRGRNPNNRQDEARQVLRLSFSIFALCALCKIFLSAHIFHYGFVLALPATLALIAAGIEWIPHWIEQHGGWGGAFRATALGALAAATIAQLTLVDAALAEKVEILGSGGDRIRADAIRGRILDQILVDLGLRLAPDTDLLVLPEGVMINYQLRLSTPTPYVNFMPPELLMYGEERILAALEAAPPDFVVLVHKNTSEYGYRFFGEDYGQLIYGWVLENFRLVHAVGGPPLRSRTRFGIAVLERIPLPSRPTSRPASHGGQL